MSQPDHRGRNDVLVYVGGALALLICCGGPLLVGALIVSGAGGWLLSQGAVVLGALALAAGVLLAALVGAKAYRTHRALTRARERARR